MVLHTDRCQDVDIIPESLSGLFFEGAYSFIAFPPCYSVEFCRDPFWAFFHQVEIVVVFLLVEFIVRYICQHPEVAAAELIRNSIPDGTGEV